MHKRSGILAIFLLVVTACSDQIGQQDDPPLMSNVSGDSRPARAALDQLTQAQADARKARLSQIAYVMNIDLVTNPDAYTGRVQVQFQLGDVDAPLDIDFTGGQVSTVVINGQSVAVDYNGFFINLPASALQIGANTVTISYQHPFDQDGTGLHRFVDPEDGHTYLYTYLWPYYSNRLFPNFDQPNLKASYELTVRAASDWHVVSAMREDSVTTEGDTRVWHFPTSPVFSSYVFSLHAGPYRIWEDQAGDIPIRLMVRQSLAEHVAVDEWLTYTKAGLSHYADYFDIDYPFYKYDQVIVPDFLIGAMENVAAVTFSESYVDRGTGTRFSSQRRANTILHEMAHMWFGDLVTKDWWNGLWLNESFATLMASIAVAEATEFDDQWHAFYLGENLTAIAADNAVSTHPIEMPVNATSDFFMVFDAITYDKGASVLNQLSHYLGEENFRLGVSSYLKQHAYDNTELADFIYALSVQSDIDLEPWAQDWLYQAGVNTLEARFSCEAGVVTSMAILQSADSSYPTLRNQRIQLGLFTDSEAGAITNVAAIPIEIIGAETPVPAALGQPCPDLVYPNYQAWGYGQVDLDSSSLDFILSTDALARIDDPLLRSMVWSALFDAPAKGQIDNAVLLERIVDSLGNETNDRIIRQVQAALVDNLNQLERLTTRSTAGDDYETVLRNYGPQAETALWDLVQQGITVEQTESRLNLQMGNYVDVARTEGALNNLIALLAGETTVPGLQLQADLRWRMIRRLAARGHPAATDLLQAERTRDTSDAGRRAAIAVEAALPELGIKQQWVQQIVSDTDPLPFSHLRAAMGALFPVGQADLQEALLPQLLSNLPTLAASRDAYFLQSYGRDLFAGLCRQSALELVSEAMVDQSSIGPTLYRFMSENVQSAQDCVNYGQ